MRDRTLTPTPQSHFQQARITRALAACRQAWERAYKDRRDEEGARVFCLQYGARAYRSVMPIPTTAEDLPIFLACFQQALVLQVFSDKEQARLLACIKLCRDFLPPSPDPLDDTQYAWDTEQLAFTPQPSARPYAPHPEPESMLESESETEQGQAAAPNFVSESAPNSKPRRRAKPPQSESNPQPSLLPTLTAESTPQPATLPTLTAAAEARPARAKAATVEPSIAKAIVVESAIAKAASAPTVGAPSFPRLLRKGWESTTPTLPTLTAAPTAEAQTNLTNLRNLTNELAGILLVTPDLPRPHPKNQPNSSPILRLSTADDRAAACA